MAGRFFPIKISSNRWSRYIKSQWQMLLTNIFFISGLVSGTVTAVGYIESGNEAIGVIISGFITSRSTPGFGQVFLSSIMSSLPFLIASFFLGLCAIGTPIIPLLSAARGVGLGVSLGYFYTSYGLNGIIYCLLMIIPGAVISCTALLLSCKESMIYSGSLFGTVFLHKKDSDISSGIRLYILRYVVCAAMILLAALIDACFTVVFSGMFKF